MPTLPTTNGMQVSDFSAAPSLPGYSLELGNQVDAFYGGKVANSGALPAAGKFAGQRVWLTDRKGFAVWTGTGWDYDVAPTTTGITYGSGFSTIAEGSKVAKTAGLVTLRVAAQKSTFNAGDTVLTVSALFRPPAGEFYRISGSFNASPRFVTIDSDGNVKADAATTGGIVGTVSFPAARP